MSDFPTDYGEGMFAFEEDQWPGKNQGGQSSSIGEGVLPTVDKFHAVDRALALLGIDSAEALTNPRVARLARSLEEITVDPSVVKEWQDKPRPGWED